MTPLDPMTTLLSLMGKQKAQDDEIPKVSPPPESDVDSLSTEFLRGFLTQNSMAGEIPSRQTFDQMFAKSVSPAREMLANALRGMSASMTGEKFRTVREQAFQEYMLEEKMKQERAQQQQTMMAHVASVASTMFKQRQQQQFQSDLANAKATEGARQFQMKYNLDARKVETAEAEFRQHVTDSLERARSNAARESQSAVPKNPNYQQALNEIQAKYQAQGLDPQKDPATRAKFLVDVADRRQELDEAAAELKNKEGTAKSTLVFVPNPGGGFSAQVIGAGQSVPEGTVTPGGMSSMSVPTSATRTMSEKAPRVVYFVDRIESILNDNESKFGPLKGRMAQFKSGRVGLKNRAWAQINADLGLLETALMNMHVGARGGVQLIEHFHSVIGGIRQDPENLRAALNEIKLYSQEVEKEGSVKTGKPLTPTHRFNPTTGKLEEVR